MLRFKLIEEKNGVVFYKYYPENEDKSGIVSIDKITKICNINKISSNDSNQIYALKILSRLRKFARDNVYEKDGIVAWY